MVSQDETSQQIDNEIEANFEIAPTKQVEDNQLFSKHDDEDIENPRSSNKGDDTPADLEEISFIEAGNELPSLSGLASTSSHSIDDLEEFSDTEEIIKYANKIHRLCDELDKVERFSDPVEHTIELARDIDATFRKWDEEDLEAFSDSEDDVVALAKKIEVDTRPPPPPTPDASPEASDEAFSPVATPCPVRRASLVRAESPVRAVSPVRVAAEPRFTESGFMIESPDNAPISQTAEVSAARFTESGFLVDSSNNTQVQATTKPSAACFTPSGFLIESSEKGTTRHEPTDFSHLGPMVFTSSPVPETPTGPRGPKPIFASPVGEPLSHARKVSNETNSSEETTETKDSNDTKATTVTAPDSPAIYSDLDDSIEYQGMGGFTICVSAKKGTAITHEPASIGVPDEGIPYDSWLRRQEGPLASPTPSPGSERSYSINESKESQEPGEPTSSNHPSEELDTPYHYSEDTPEDIEILTILEIPGRRKYAKLNCGNWYFYRDDGNVDHMNWEEYEELLAYIVNEVASLPLKLKQLAVDTAAKYLNRKEQEAVTQEEQVAAEESVIEEEAPVQEPIVTVG